MTQEKKRDKIFLCWAVDEIKILLFSVLPDAMAGFSCYNSKQSQSANHQTDSDINNDDGEGIKKSLSFKQRNFIIYQSWWNNIPVLHIAGWRREGNKGVSKEIWDTIFRNKISWTFFIRLGILTFSPLS